MILFKRKASLKSLVTLVLSVGLMAQVEGQKFEISDGAQINVREEPAFKKAKILFAAQSGDTGIILKIEARVDGRQALYVDFGNGRKGWILYAKQNWLLLKDLPKAAAQPVAEAPSAEIEKATEALYVRAKKNGVPVYVSLSNLESPYGGLNAEENYEIDQQKWDPQSDWIPLKAKGLDGNPVTAYVRKDAEILSGKLTEILKALSASPAETACKEVPLSEVPANLVFEGCPAVQAAAQEALNERLQAKRPSMAEVLKSDLAACVLASQKDEASHSFQYLNCQKTKNGKWTSSKNKSNRPCVSPQVTAIVTAELQDTADCFGISEGELFNVFNHESRLMPNAMSGTGAAGVAQLTDIAIKDVLNSEGIASRSVIPTSTGYLKLKDQDKSTCTRIKEQIKSAPNPGGDCDYASGKDNPLRNIAVGALYYLSNRKAAMQMMKDWIDTWKKMDDKMEVDPEKIQSVAKDLAVWMHNGGTGGIRGPFMTWMKKNSPAKKEIQITDKEKSPAKVHKFPDLDLKRFQSGFSEYLKSNYTGNENRKKEVGNYVPNVYSDRDKMRSESGKACGI